MGAVDRTRLTPTIPEGQTWAVQVWRGRVWLSVGHQHFVIDYHPDSMESLEWMARMVRGAVEEALQAEAERLREMLGWCWGKAGQGLDVDGGEFQDEMVARGLLEVHPANEEAYVLAWAPAAKP